jgi:3-phosphoshikimate 1-carboxyvinyltransferase
MKTLALRPLDRPFHATIRPPGSKSYTNRALPVAALAGGTSLLTGVLESDDTLLMMDSLRRLGFAVAFDPLGCTAEVQGGDGAIPAAGADLFVGNSGTTLRFLAAFCALGHGTYKLDGTARMRERPIGDLLAALRGLGVDATAAGDFPPVSIQARGWPGGAATVRGDTSSQFLSALLMAAPAAAAETEIRVAGELVSAPYVEMTLAVMADFGVTVERREPGVFLVPPQHYEAREYAIEPDASAASYWFGAAAIAGGQATVPGLGSQSLQGDLGFVRVLEKMGCRVEQTSDSTTVHGGPLRGVEVDMGDLSDTVPTLAAVACFASGPTRIRNAAHVRVKECDRLAASAAELRKAGAEVDETADGLVIHPRPLHGASFATYDDHRMAMALALIGLKVPGVSIQDPDCVGKTYPGFWRDFAAATD